MEGREMTSSGPRPPGGNGDAPRRWQPLRAFIRRHLSPADRLADTLCGLIMVLTFTLVAAPMVKEGPEGVRELLFATVGCNIAWGIIDGALYVLCAMSQRAYRARFVQRVKGAPDGEAALGLIRARLEEEIPPGASADDRERLYLAIAPVLVKAETSRERMTLEDFLGGLAILAVEVACTVPAVLPFLFIGDHWLALRTSNALLLLLLWVVGYWWGRHVTGRPWGAGLVMLLIGGGLVGVAVALGG